MKRRKIRLVAIDLDGTLIPADLTLSPPVRDAIARVLAQDVAVTLVTGRMFKASRSWAERLGIRGPIVCYQGAAIYVAESGERLFHVPVAIETGKRVFERLAADGVGALGYLDDELYAEREDALVARYEGLSQVRARMIPSLRELFENRASTKIVILLPRVQAAEYAANLRESLGSEAYVTRSIPEYIEVLDPKVNKGAALAAVARHYGVGLEETLAIGDSWNDEPLLRAAGVGVAMGNSPPELLAVADAVVGDVFHDGVAEALERFVLGAAPEAVR